MRFARVLRDALPTAPALLALLPSFSCPLCVSAGLGVAASLGLGVVLTARVLAPIILGLLAVSLTSVAWTGRRLRVWGPTLWTTVGAFAVAWGRILHPIPALAHAGAALLILASILNLRQKRNPVHQGAPAPGATP